MISARGIAVGAALDGTALLRAQLPGISNEAWTQFIHALTIADEVADPDDPGFGRPRAFDARLPSGGLGCFGILPRRLADLGRFRNIRVDNEGRRCVVVGDFISPMTWEKFTNPLAQYDFLLDSLRRYDRRLSGEALPEGMTRSGALALHHRLGPSALSKWAEHQETSTMALYRRTNGLF